MSNWYYSKSGICTCCGCFLNALERKYTVQTTDPFQNICNIMQFCLSCLWVATPHFLKFLCCHWAFQTFPWSSLPKSCQLALRKVEELRRSSLQWSYLSQHHSWQQESQAGCWRRELPSYCIFCYSIWGEGERKGKIKAVTKRNGRLFLATKSGTQTIFSSKLNPSTLAKMQVKNSRRSIEY